MNDIKLVKVKQMKLKHTLIFNFYLQLNLYRFANDDSTRQIMPLIKLLLPWIG